MGEEALFWRILVEDAWAPEGKIFYVQSPAQLSDFPKMERFKDPANFKNKTLVSEWHTHEQRVIAEQDAGLDSSFFMTPVKGYQSSGSPNFMEQISRKVIAVPPALA